MTLIGINKVVRKLIEVIKCGHTCFWYESKVGERYVVTPSASNDLLYNLVDKIDGKPRALFIFDCITISEPMEPIKHLEERVRI
jgi:hypothetical protein